MRVLIACEESQAVCIAFREKGHEAYSCDVQECSGGHPEWHIQDDVMKHINDGWDMMIAFPPCTYLTNSANRHFKSNPERWEKRLQAIRFVWALMKAKVNKIAIENPVGAISSWIRKPDQIIQPYWFGDPVQKSTCLWLKNLPLLKPTDIVEPEYLVYNSKKTKTGKSKYSIHGKLGKGHGKERSKTFPSIANAMAEQWG